MHGNVKDDQTINTLKHLIRTTFGTIHKKPSIVVDQGSNVISTGSKSPELSEHEDNNIYEDNNKEEEDEQQQLEAE